MVLFNFFAVIVIFPAMIVIDRSRRKSGKYDLLCCIERLVHVFIIVIKLSALPKNASAKLISAKMFLSLFSNLDSPFLFNN